MKNKVVNTGIGLYLVQLKWAAYTAVIASIIYTALYIVINGDPSLYSAWALLNNVFTVFVFIVGIIAGYTFLSYFVKHGLTRRHYFYSALISLILLIISMILLAYAVDLLASVISLLGFSLSGDLGIDFIGNHYSGVLGFIIFFSMLLLNYALGWFIGASIIRFKAVGGLYSITSTVILFIIISTLTNVDSSITIMFVTIDSSPITNVFLALSMYFVVSAAILTGIYYTNRNSPVKLD